MKKIILLAALWLPVAAAFSQTAPRSVLSAAGESSVSANYRMDWTLGEVSTETGTVTGRIYTQGFNQPSLSVKKISESPAGEISVMPNPVQDRLNIVFNSMSDTKVLVILTDEQGRQVIAQESTIAGGRISLAMGNVARGAYFLSVNNLKGALIGTFRIIKN